MPRETASRVPPWLLALATLATPALVVIALELGLRGLGLGGHEPLFVAAPQMPGLLQPNPRVATRLVADPRRPPLTEIDPVHFRIEKPETGLRIFVQGGSSAAGYPFGRWGSLSELLQQRLRRTFPGREVEVIGTAMAAVNSYALLDFADEIVAERPDAVLVYAGHNEYLGILGVGSRQAVGAGRWATLTFLRARDLALFQLLAGFRTQLGRVFAGGNGGASGGTLMARVVGEPEISLDSSLYRRGLEQFRGNLDALLARYRAAEIPVYLGTLASNERDQSPLISGLAPTTDAAAWETDFAGARLAFERGDLAGAESQIDALLRRDDGFADAHYLRGRVLERTGRPGEARAAYLAAKDRDLLRFRAPEAINGILRELAAEHGAVLVEVQRLFVEASPRGAIGRELMLEHLHPNPEGYFLLADAYYDALEATELGGPFPQPVPDAVARRDSPITEVDRIAGEQRVAVLKANWPFQRHVTGLVTPDFTPRNEIERLAHQMEKKEITWTEAMAAALAYYERTGNPTESARVAVNLAEAVPLSARASARAGSLLLQLGRPRAALPYLERAAALSPGVASYAESVAAAHAEIAGRDGS